MNRAIQKMVMALAVCGALCGMAMAYPPNAVRAERPIGSEGIAERSECRAPKGNPPPKGKAPTAMKAPAQKPPAAKAHAPVAHTAKAPAPAKHTPQATKAPGRAHAAAHSAPMRPAPRQVVARHAPPPPPHAKHHEPKHHHDNRHHDCYHSTTLHTEDWCDIGASLLGGLVGGLIGASI